MLPCNYTLDNDPWCLICESQRIHYLKHYKGYDDPISNDHFVMQINGFSCLMLGLVGIFLLTNTAFKKHPYRLIGICCLLEGFSFWAYREIKCNLTQVSDDIEDLEARKLGFITGI